MSGGLAQHARRAYARLYLWTADRLYHEGAPLYDPVSRLVSGGRWAHWRRIALDYVRGSDVLEVGFGTGELLFEMAARGWKVTGVDPSAAMQRVTNRKLRRTALGPTRVQGRVEALPFGAARFDSVVSTFPTPYIVQSGALCEIARVLRPGGRLVVVGLTVQHERRALTPSWYGQPPSEPGLERCRELADAAGLRVRLISRFDPPSRIPVLIAERSGDYSA